MYVNCFVPVIFNSQLYNDSVLVRHVLLTQGKCSTKPTKAGLDGTLLCMVKVTYAQQPCIQTLLWAQQWGILAPNQHLHQYIRTYKSASVPTSGKQTAAVITSFA